MKLAVVALGGNSLIHPKERGTAEKQIKRVNKTISHLKPLARKFTLVLTHGSGPQVGNLLFQQKLSKKTLPEMPLDTLDSMVQGQLGYWIQQAVENVLHKNAVTIITRVLVDKSDNAFKHPTKPIGQKSWKKMVASPIPIQIIDVEKIKALVKNNFVVIACGGGGIPVIKKVGKFSGVEAVVDKDHATQKLASQLKADTIIFLTDVQYVFYNYGKSSQKPLRKLSIENAIKYLKDNQFEEGSMKPKIEASVEFLKKGGKKVLITSPEKLNLALKGKAGTVVE
ncbi:MAG: carbamate kinase [Candidatus Aenigmarchaeota archaeon]|nr:carbamate kinase [Candidatus Aenigmarchaeota archaeon]